MPGDDIRKIDWRVYARTDRYYLKEFEADTNTNCTIALDISRSMSFGKDGLSKFDYGRFLAACLAYFAHKQRDRIGLVTFDHEVVDWIPPSAKHLEAILHTIDRTRCERLGSLRPPLMRLASRTRRSSIVIVISDFYENPEDVVRTIGLLRGQGNDVIVFHVLDDAEVSFSFDQDAEFEDLETGDRMALSPGAAREDYARRIAEHIDRLRQMLTEGGVDYSLLTTSMPLDFGLFSYLSSRQKAARVR